MVQCRGLPRWSGYFDMAAVVVAGLAMLAMAPAAAGANCERILSSDLPYALRGSTVTIMDTTHREGVATFEVTRGEPTKVIVKIGLSEEAALELAYKGIFPTRSVVLKSNQVTEYDYATSIGDALTPGAELRYTRVVKLNGEVSSAETGIAHVGERGRRAVGECQVEVIEVTAEVKSDKAPTRAATLLFAPRLGFFVKSDQAGLGLKGNVATTFAATSIELLP